MGPTSTHVPIVAGHIANLLKTPDLLFIQEIQDNSGETDDGTVASDATVAALVGAIESASGVKYSFVQIDPINNQDGGVPGGNIRPVFLCVPLLVLSGFHGILSKRPRYRPEKLQLIPGSPVGGSLDAVEVTGNKKKNLQLT